MKKVSLVVVLALLFMPAVAGAFDYKAWLPMLPRTLGGMVPSGEPDGMNMEMGGQKWSSLNQEYKSRDGKRTAQLSIVAGQMAPQVQGFQGMAAMKMNMETSDQVMKTVNVSGKNAMLMWDKKDKSGTLTIPIKKDMVMVLTLEPTRRASELTSLAQQIPIARFGYVR
ncbi:MAG: hypothetical protein JRI36_14255 [Deltaproteobacteria bacterium]|nr:hypothetical protein [Deltaproteobacteria bacterium]